MSWLDDDELLLAMGALEGLGRVVDWYRVVLAGEVAERSTIESGRERRLSVMRGCRSAAELIERVTQASGQEARRRVSLGEATRAQTSFTRLVRDPVSAQELTAAHLDIHRALAALTGSPRLIATADALYAEIRLALAHLDRARGNTHEQVHAHGDLLRLLERGHLDEARAMLREHLAGAEQSLLESVRPD